MRHKGGLPDRTPGPERVCPGPAGRVWVLDVMKEKFHSMSPGDYEGMFTEAGDSETRKALA